MDFGAHRNAHSLPESKRLPRVLQEASLSDPQVLQEAGLLITLSWKKILPYVMITLYKTRQKRSGRMGLICQE